MLAMIAGRTRAPTREAADTGGIRAAPPAGGVGNREAHCLSARRARFRSADKRSLMTHELIAPVMFGALVIMLLLIYPVAFSLAATAFFSRGWAYTSDSSVAFVRMCRLFSRPTR